MSAPLLRAQTARPKYVVAWLSPVSASDSLGDVTVFRSTLKELGYVEGRDYALEWRYAEGKLDRLADFARELIALKPTVIVTASSAAVATLQKATATVPIVFATASSPVEQGFVKSLARPGGNITGVTLRSEVGGKLLELVRDCLPSAHRIALLEHESDTYTKTSVANYRKNAAPLRYELSVVLVQNAEGLARAFSEVRALKADAVLVPQLSLFVQHVKAVAELAQKARVPLFSQFRATTDNGGLLSYFSDTRENYRRAAVLVDKIFSGARPDALPVEEPNRYLLVVNTRSAKALGINLPQALLLRADEVIE